MEVGIHEKAGQLVERPASCDAGGEWWGYSVISNL